MSEDALRGLFLALEEPDAPPLCLAALADWYEEHGDAQAAECLRWAARKGRRLGQNPHQTPYGPFFWERENVEPLLNDPLAQLPERLWLAIGDNDEKHPVGSYKSYGSAQAAYQALIAGWKRTGGLPGPET